jgi:beta-glucosidase
MSEWIGGTAAVLEGWMMGQAGGGAVSDVLFGRVNPSGKLTETFPIKLTDTPAQINFPGENKEARYGEGIFIGYRYYDAKESPVLFPFGYGGSYTTFAFSSPRASATAFKDNEGLTVSVDVTNTGKVAGKEVVQVYIHDLQSRLARPPKELKGFAKVELQPGETKTVTIPLDFRSFAFYHPAYRQWITEDGEFDIMIGASSADIRFTLTVTLQSTLKLPSLLDRGSTVREWLDDPSGKAAIEPFFQQILAQVKNRFGDGAEANKEIERELKGLMDTPLLSILQFGEGELPLPAVDVVDMLLSQVR